MWKTLKKLKRILLMENEKIDLDCRLLTWIKKTTEESKDSQIILTVKDGSIIRASSYLFSSFKADEDA